MRSVASTILVLMLLPMAGWCQSSTQFKPLLDAAKKSHSDALIVIQDGKKVVDYQTVSSKEKIESMSVTKSVVGLAIARLLTEGKIDSLDIPITHYYPEWKQGQKKDITLRHLMNHTSGLQNVPITTKEIQPSKNVLQLALCASVVDEPGSVFSYNNKAVNILSGIIKKTANKPMDDYLQEGLFKDMGITDFNWRTDPSGNLLSMSGFQVHPDDLAKLGQLVLHKGSWNGEQLIAKKWINELLAQGQPHDITGGLLWWRIPSKKSYAIDEKSIAKLKEAGLDETYLSRLKKVKGTYQSKGQFGKKVKGQFTRKEFLQFRMQLKELGVKPWRTSVSGPILGYQAKGYLGQFLVVYPRENIVAVRMIKPSRDYNNQTDGFANFADMVYRLATDG